MSEIFSVRTRLQSEPSTVRLFSIMYLYVNVQITIFQQGRLIKMLVNVTSFARNRRLNVKSHLYA